jgi:tetratricopeptide (TPR) repeat protein
VSRTVPDEDKPDELALFRQTLADLLVALRKDAGLSQQQLADHIGYSRATIAGAETCHRSASAEFWARADDLLASNGELRSAYGQLTAAREARDRQRTQRAEEERDARIARRDRGQAWPELPAPAAPGVSEFGSDRLPSGSVGLDRASSRWLSRVDIGGAVDWPAWFGVRLTGLFRAVESWPRPAPHYDDLQALLHREMLMFDAAAPDDSAAHFLSRRQALVSLAALPLTLAGWPGAGAAEALLPPSAAGLTACWHLLRGSDLDTVEQLLSPTLVPLEALAQQHGSHRQAAARLASQAHRIYGIVALHRNHVRLRERHCEQALYYARIGGDASTEAAALISLASTYFYQGQPAQAAHLYEGVLVQKSAIPRLQRSRLHAELSVVYGQLGREHDALRCLGMAEDLYPDQPELDPSSLYAEFTPASLTLERGLAFLTLAEQYPNRGYPDRARDIFEQTSSTSPAAAPARIRFEIANHQAAAAVFMNDLDAFETHLYCGIDGVGLLKSRQRHRETVAVWRQANKAWPHEPRLTVLRERLRCAGVHIGEAAV